MDKKSVEIKRTINAPVEKVWDAFTNPEIYKKWYGPEHMTIPAAEFDFVEGGKFLVTMENAEKTFKMHTSGQFLEIKPMEKFVYTDHMANEKGEQIDGPNFTVAILFKKLDENSTEVTVYYDDVSGIDEQALQGMQWGWNQALDKLVRNFE